MESLYIKKLNKVNIKAGLYIVSTPIGNLEDITLRAINILKNSDLILCEDTRISSRLLKKYDIKVNLSSNHKFNEKKNLKIALDKIRQNKILSIISDAGTPLISDPGLLLVKECIKNKIPIFPIPGPSAVTAAVSVSGFDDKYLFYGFLPSSESEIKKELKNLVDLPYSLVFFSPSKKINKAIRYFKLFFKDRKIMIGREITKYFEEFIRTDINSLKLFDILPKGEITIVISNSLKVNKKLNKINESVKKEIKIMLKKYSSKDTADFFSKKENISKKIIYDYCLTILK